MAERWMERKFAGLKTEPMFEPASGRATETKRKPPKNIGRADCPECGKNIGLYVLAVRNGFQRVIAYRRHWRTRFSGTAFICPASNTEHDQPEGA